MENHDWHMYDVQKQIEVMFRDGMYYVKFVEQIGEDQAHVLTPEEFNAFRSGELKLEGM